jgi:hypothetical protein
LDGSVLLKAKSVFATGLAFTFLPGALNYDLYFGIVNNNPGCREYRPDGKCFKFASATANPTLKFRNGFKALTEELATIVKDSKEF